MLQDRRCTKCAWTVNTGGMTEDAHAQLGHGPLVRRGVSPPASGPARCRRCGAAEAAPGPCRYHDGKKDEWQRMMHPKGQHVRWTWACCGAKYDSVCGAQATPPGQHDDGCKTAATHQF